MSVSINVSFYSLYLATVFGGSHVPICLGPLEQLSDPEISEASGTSLNPDSRDCLPYCRLADMGDPVLEDLLHSRKVPAEKHGSFLQDHSCKIIPFLLDSLPAAFVAVIFLLQVSCCTIVYKLRKLSLQFPAGFLN